MCPCCVTHFSQVESFSTVTASTVLLSLFTPSPLIDGHQDRSLWLVGPCAGEALIAALHFRIDNRLLNSLLDRMLAWGSSRQRSSTTSGTSAGIGNGGGNNSSGGAVLSPKKSQSRSNNYSSYSSYSNERRLLSQNSVGSLSEYHHHPQSRDGAFMAAMDAALLLEQRTSDIALRSAPSGNRGYSGNYSNSNNDSNCNSNSYNNCQYFGWEMHFLELVYRLVMKSATAIESSSSFSSSGLAVDLQQQQQQQEAVDTELVDWIARRAVFFDCDADWLNELPGLLAVVVGHVRNMVFLAINNNNNSSISSISSSNRRVQTSRLQRYLKANHQAVVSTLDGFVATRQDFDRIPSLQFKCHLVRLAVQSNDWLTDSVHTILRLAHWPVSEDLTLRWPLFVSPEQLVTWFVFNVAAEVKRWIARTIHSAFCNRESQSHSQSQQQQQLLPWDVELLGHESTSHLPESFQMQLDVFRQLQFNISTANISSTTGTNGNNDYGIATTNNNNRNSNNSSTNGVNSSGGTHQWALTLSRANEDMETIAGHSWLLLLHEFTRALQSRHWDEASTAEEQTAFLRFLCAVANDALHIQSICTASAGAANTTSAAVASETTSITTAITAGTTTSAAVTAVRAEVEAVVSQAVHHLVKVTFSATTATLLDLDSRWFEQNDLDNSAMVNGVSPCQLLLQNVANHVRRLQSMCHPVVVSQFVEQCFTVLVLRMLLLFRTHLAANRALTAEDTRRLTRDVEQCKAVAAQLLPATDGSPPVVASLSFLVHFAHLLTDDPASSSATFNASLLWIFRQFDLSDQDQRSFVELLLLHCALPLRHDAVDAYPFFFAVLDAPSPSTSGTEKYAEHISFAAITSNLYFRAFGDLLFPTNNNLLLAENNNNNSNSNSTNNSNRLPVLLLTLRSLQPSTALKQLREKASDLVLSSSRHFRQNEDEALHLLRMLELERDPQQLLRTSATMRTNEVLLRFFGEIGGGNDESFSSATTTTTTAAAGERSQKRPSIKTLLDGLFDQPTNTVHNNINNNSATNNTLTTTAIATTTTKGRTVEISAVAVRGLQSFSVMGEANPYVYFSVGESRTKTSVKWNHCDAQWDEESFTLQVSSVELMTENLLVEVYDKERIRRKRLLGMTAIKLQSFSVNPSGSWYALEGGDKASYGEIHLRVLIK
jgi:hypothetical protein